MANFKDNEVSILSKNNILFKISKKDLALVSQHEWTVNKKGYVIRPLVSEWQFLHRFLVSAPDGMYIDHIDRDPLNNTRENLRLCTHQENCFNRGSYNAKGNTSEYKGVCYSKSLGLFRATISINSVQESIGLYCSENDAAIAYNKRAKVLFGKYAYLNEIKKTDNVIIRKAKPIGKNKYRGISLNKSGAFSARIASRVDGWAINKSFEKLDHAIEFRDRASLCWWGFHAQLNNPSNIREYCKDIFSINQDNINFLIEENGQLLYRALKTARY